MCPCCNFEIDEDMADATKQHQKGLGHRKNYAAIHAHPIPLHTLPLPAFYPSNPLSFIRLAFVLLKEHWYTKPPSCETIHKGYYSTATRSVHVTDHDTARALWEQGFFGKGSLSRSEPEWLDREKRRLGLLDEDDNAKTAAEVTQQRRKARKEGKRERAKRETEELEERLKEEGKLTIIKAENKKSAINEGPRQHVEHTSYAGSNTSHAMSEGPPNTKRTIRLPSDVRPEDRLANQIHVDRALPRMRSGVVLQNQEHLQLAPEEALFLCYGLGVLQVHPKPLDNCKTNDYASKPDTVRDSGNPSKPLSTNQLLSLFRRTSKFPPTAIDQYPPPDDRFLVNYVVYHHFRSLGWVVRAGIKFGVDYLLYARGPAFHHAEFGAVVLPSYSHPHWQNKKALLAIGKDSRQEHIAWKERGEWWWLHAVNRVQNQVMKTLVLVYVEIPPPSAEREQKGSSTNADQAAREMISDVGELLRQYQVTEFIIRRWSPKRGRD